MNTKIRVRYYCAQNVSRTFVEKCFDFESCATFTEEASVVHWQQRKYLQFILELNEGGRGELSREEARMGQTF